MWLQSSCPMLLFLLSVGLLISIPNTRSDDDVEGKDLQVCNPKAFQELLTRLEALEEAVRGLISAQTYRPFSPSASRMLERNPAMRSIFQSISSKNEAWAVANNSTSSVEDGPTTSIANKNSITEDARINSSENMNTMLQLKGALKCSALLDIHFADKPSAQISGATKVLLQDDNKSVEIVWTPPLADCLQYFSGLWIRMHEVDQDPLSIPYLSISRKCLKADNGGTSFSIILPSSSEDECNFSLENLTECRSYKVEIIANYQSLRGIVPFRTEIVVPPAKGGNSTALESLVSISTNADALLLNWEDNSGCASRLTSINLSITPAGEPLDEENWDESRFLTISRQCIKRLSKESNLFSLTVTANPCSPEWQPLDKCRKYRIEMESQYSSTWTGPKTTTGIFTSSSASYPMDPTESWKCPNKEHYYCPSQQQCRYYGEVCDGGNHCYSPNVNSKGSPGYLDELYCDMNMNKDCSKGFKCGRQCLPFELVCDGKYDCFNGEDEGVQCGYLTSCRQITKPFGSFDSALSSVPINSTSGARSDLFRRSIVSISVNPNSIVWLDFEKIERHFNYTNMKVYDGPYFSSPLLLTHTNESRRPISVRSSGSDLYVVMDSFQNQTQGVRIFYTSMENPGNRFVPGCGGYINGQGVVISPVHASNHEDDNCFWFIESRQKGGTVLLQQSSSTTYPNSMIVYDGWDMSGERLYDHKNRGERPKEVIYSISHKMMVQFKIPSSETKAPNSLVHSWNVFNIYTPHCKEHLTEPSGTIKSVNYPAPYPGSSDCHWHIATATGSRIRLLFAFFDTLEAMDFVSVYDGWNLDSSLLMEKSGYVASPFVISSSSNEVLIRFTSHSSIKPINSGFLAVYSTV